MIELVELIGYLASILVAISLTMKNVVRLRLINLTGAIVFTIYGLIIQAYPVALVNGIIIFINIYHLNQIIRTEDYFNLLFLKPKDQFVAHFLKRNAMDLGYYFPEFKLEQAESAKCVLILRNQCAVGLFIYRLANSHAEVLLDYVIPEYRDLKNARFLFSRVDRLFQEEPIQELIAVSSVKEHQEYLLEVGFQRVQGQSDTFRMNKNAIDEQLTIFF